MTGNLLSVALIEQIIYQQNARIGQKNHQMYEAKKSNKKVTSEHANNYIINFAVLVF